MKLGSYFRDAIKSGNDVKQGAKDQPTWLSSVSCRDDAADLNDCSNWKLEQQSCDHTTDVGLKCDDTFRNGGKFVK